MVFGDLNLVFILFFCFFLAIALNVNTALHLLLTAELMWISLYIIVLLIGFLFDNVNMLSLTFFFLIFSAAEFALGLVIILLQHILLRSIYINTMSKNTHKFSVRFQKKIPTKSLIL
jgi:NADH:ubiquinone oxidoreductase subunit K